jgi:septum formation protein
VGAIVLVDLTTGDVVSGVHTADVYFHTIPDDVVSAMLAEGDCLQCAGGLMVEHPLVQPYIERVDGSLDSVMGLSKDLVLELMQQLRPQL